MVNLAKGSFEINFGLIKLSGELKDDDRQCAWELYTELCTRVAVTGKEDDPKCLNFDGELYIESLNSVYRFFQEARLLMRKFPVGKIRGNNKSHLGVYINIILEKVIRPFLEKWHVSYRHWWEHESNSDLTPMERQKQFPNLKTFKEEWSALRQILREVQKDLVNKYKLVGVSSK